MGTRLTGMLILGLLCTGTASAEGRDWSIGYIVQAPTTLTVRRYPLYQRYPNETFIELMSKPFAPVAASTAESWDTGRMDFRRPGPELLIPTALRRPAQLRLGFSVRF